VTKSCFWDESSGDIEAIVHAAGQYIAVSDNLRPRVLEAIRLQQGEQRTQHCLRHVALFVILLALFTSEFRQGFDDQRTPFNVRLVQVGEDEANSSDPSTITRSGDADWHMIDAFTKLRRQQAQLLRLEI